MACSNPIALHTTLDLIPLHGMRRSDIHCMTGMLRSDSIAWHGMACLDPIALHGMLRSNSVAWHAQICQWLHLFASDCMACSDLIPLHGMACADPIALHGMAWHAQIRSINRSSVYAWSSACMISHRIANRASLVAHRSSVTSLIGRSHRSPILSSLIDQSSIAHHVSPFCGRGSIPWFPLIGNGQLAPHDLWLYIDLSEITW